MAASETLVARWNLTLAIAVIMVVSSTLSHPLPSCSSNAGTCKQSSLALLLRRHLQPDVKYRDIFAKNVTWSCSDYDLTALTWAAQESKLIRAE